MTQEQGMDFSVRSWLYNHFTFNVPAVKVDLTGRTVLVTGGTAGIGYAAVLHFARCNASRIIIAARSLARCTTAAEKVYKDVPTYRGVVDVLQLDLASFDSVISFAKAVNADPGRLDIVVANAGILKTAFGKTKDGYEEVAQVNGLSTALMPLLLLPKLEEAAGLEVPIGSKGLKPTMSIVASDAHYMTKYPQQNVSGSLFEALNDPAQFVSGQERYFVSKLLNLFTTREIAKLPAVTSGKVLVNCVNPGLCASDIHDAGGPILAWIMKSVAWSTEKGARNLLYAATQPTTPGAFINYSKETPPSSFLVSAKGREQQERFWKESLALFRGLGQGEGLDRVLKA